MAKILVIDDERDILTMVAASLRAAGHEVVTVDRGAEGLRAVADDRFDAILLDIMMPEMDGYTVLESLRGTPAAEVPVIVMTARHEPAGLAREVESGAVDHIAKPFLPSELESAIERVLSGVDGSNLRRRILGTDAAVYGSMYDLVDEARHSTAPR